MTITVPLVANDFIANLTGGMIAFYIGILFYQFIRFVTAISSHVCVCDTLDWCKRG